MEIRVEAPIAAVTVYSDRALIVRSARVEIPEAGEHTPQSGRVAGKVRAKLVTGRWSGIRLALASWVSSRKLRFTPSLRWRSCSDSSVKSPGFAVRSSMVDARQTIIEEQRAWLRTLGEQAARRMANGIAVNTARPEDASALFTFTGDESERLVADKLTLDTRREELQRELDARQREHQRAEQQRQT